MYVSEHCVAVYNSEQTAAVLLNMKTAGRAFLNNTLSVLWRQLEEGVDFEEACCRTAKYFKVPLERLQNDLTDVIATLKKAEMLVATPPKSSNHRPGAIARFPEGQDYQGQCGISMIKSQAPTVWYYFLPASIGLVGALLLLRLPFRRWVAVLKMCRRYIHTPASYGQADQISRAVRCLAVFYLGRAACLEVSLATFIANASIGRLPVWCLGSRFDHVEHHAWVEVGDVPVNEQIMQGIPYGAHLRI